MLEKTSKPTYARMELSVAPRSLSPSFSAGVVSFSFLILVAFWVCSVVLNGSFWAVWVKFAGTGLLGGDLVSFVASFVLQHMVNS
jgi:hypothetical protein